MALNRANRYLTLLGWKKSWLKTHGGHKGAMMVEELRVVSILYPGQWVGQKVGCWMVIHCIAAQGPGWFVLSGHWSEDRLAGAPSDWWKARQTCEENGDHSLNQYPWSRKTYLIRRSAISNAGGSLGRSTKCTAIEKW